MASSKGHDSDRAPDVKQEAWLAAVAQGQTPTDAARTAGYKNPRSAAYDNQRSPLLRRISTERLARVAQERDERHLPSFRVLVEALSATKTERCDQGYRQVPDHATRLKAAERIDILTGIDPRYTPRSPKKAKKAASPTRSGPEIAEAYRQIRLLPEEERIAAYEELKRSLRESRGK